MSQTPYPLSRNVLSWATDLDMGTNQQAHRTASMPFVEKPLALMPDAHLGKGSTVGSVVATKGAVIPACVGVDLGCGMIAAQLDISLSELPDDLDIMHGHIAEAIPAGQPKKGNRSNGSHHSMPAEFIYSDLVHNIPGYLEVPRVGQQFGTLGGGNHFVELTYDENENVWLVLHSGSRGAGNQVAQHHIKIAKGLMKDYFIDLPDPDLAYLVQGTPEFEHYITEMLWAQDYAMGNRQQMLRQALGAISYSLAHPVEIVGEPINCHHNYCEREHHHNQNLWVTRKGAISARAGERGVIPGSMATGSFIVEGLGSKASYTSASHGAGRKLSRTAARKQLVPESLVDRMEGIAWNDDPGGLLDEHPDAYKDLGQVMSNQADLVRPIHRLTTILNYKGA